jgi:hypothetical protein
MRCQSCGNQVEPSQRFCGRCGSALRGITDVAPPVGSEPGNEAGEGVAWAASDPDWAPTGSLPTMPLPAAAGDGTPNAIGVTGSLPATEPLPTAARRASPLDAVQDAANDELDDVWALASEGYHADDPGPRTDRTVVYPSGDVWRDDADRTTRTAEMPTAVVARPGYAPVAAAPARFRFGVVTLAGLVAAITALVGSFTTAVSITTDTRLVIDDRTPPLFRTGTWILDDLADNMSGAMLVSAILIVVGGIAAGFRWRWGSGLAGGAGLALTGLGALAVGLAQLPIDVAKDYAAIPSAQPFTLTITRDVGYWLFVVAAAFGLIVFFASLAVAFGDRRPGLNPWIAALGALATVVAAVGPMLPQGVAEFGDNWYMIEGSGEPSSMLLAGRLVQLALLLASGVLGYLCVRRWGLGLAIGGALPIVWLAISALFGLTDNPIGPGYRNPGAADADLHGMTIIGISAVLAIGLLAVVAAYDQSVRERPR